MFIDRETEKVIAELMDEWRYNVCQFCGKGDTMITNKGESVCFSCYIKLYHKIIEVKIHD
jgi:hypothetical protein